MLFQHVSVKSLIFKFYIFMIFNAFLKTSKTLSISSHSGGLGPPRHAQGAPQEKKHKKHVFYEIRENAPERLGTLKT